MTRADIFSGRNGWERGIGERSLPETAVAASLGCGNPTALIDLEAGQTVLDLGSGGGIDVLLSAKRVGPTGRVYEVDDAKQILTDAGLDVNALARQVEGRIASAFIRATKPAAAAAACCAPGCCA